MADATTPAVPAPAAPQPLPKPAAAAPKPKRESDDKIFVWPDLVAEEFVAALFFTALLCAWAIWINSPLEEAANPNRTPNPSKAPWYFVGLQELLVYFDPWIAGVILPGLIIAGLMAIPYIDNDQRGVGWYSVRIRPLASTIFLSGLGMWFVLIFIGYYMRGPSWGLYMPWESWEVHKPFPPDTWSFTTAPTPGSADKPAIIGGLLLALYFGAGMLVPAKLFPNFYKGLGVIKYAIVMGLLLLMIGIPIKVILRLGFAIKYVFSIPQVNLNI
jgi:hypothetical protein